jgi:hypothetical protein
MAGRIMGRKPSAARKKRRPRAEGSVCSRRTTRRARMSYRNQKGTRHDINQA